MASHTQWITLTSASFRHEVLNANTPVLVDCWASWCTAFHQINPVVCGVAIDFSKHIKFGRLDVAIAQDWATCYRIRAVPTLLFFKEGQVIDQVVGGLSEAELNRRLISLIALRTVSRSRVSCL
ncbi:thioredoxin domain-containing protein [Thermoleptolyngbya sp. M55_K2018_002]|uniref:thioredoxin family protein n=1 Tax=Thermoleptolyngbya sp. M55_K2018_002 TaxID=2747808 RepID=UPI001A0C2473|nr:thioredoxin domain-containing protein [Thermoleptolyngbya sp. M55_K2018_002]HIK41992.1 thioredoxin [Thermoleptolyngbya sp. M55_K2018_002]